jgi:hypothetical protein
METPQKHKKGDLGKDGRIFWEYSKHKKKDGQLGISEIWLEEEKFKKRQELKLKREANRYQKNKEEITRKRNFPENKERARKYMDWYRKEYREKVKISKSKWAKKPHAKERKRIKMYEYRRRLEVKKRVNKYFKERRVSDPQFGISLRVRSRITSALRLSSIRKSHKTRDLIGCSYAFLKKHIEKQFCDGMSWDKPNSFHIDHIRPLASFDLTDPKQLKDACHWTNLQPLYPQENLSKGAKIPCIDLQR